MQLLQHNRKTHHVILLIILVLLHTFTCGIQLQFRILILMKVLHARAMIS